MAEIPSTIHGMTAYGLAKASNGRLSVSQAYRLAQDDGRFGFISSDVLEVLCDTFDVGPGELLERGRKRGRR
jgi:DNA-binding Xre family transcriptional regulator